MSTMRIVYAPNLCILQVYRLDQCFYTYAGNMRHGRSPAGSKGVAALRRQTQHVLCSSCMNVTCAARQGNA